MLSALENLSDADLKLLTLYVYEGYTVTEISKVLGVSQPTISIKIKRITNFALENLSDADLKLLTLYVYEGYTVTEISKVLGVSQPTISIKIKRITNFLKKFDFNAMD